MSDLKNCPFCGETRIIVNDDVGINYVECFSCGGQVILAGTADEAITNWNTRQPRFSETEREALERIIDNLGYRMPTLKNQDPESPIVVAIATVREMLKGESQ